jgi:phage-related protein
VADEVANLLLLITGDSGDAQQDLAALLAAARAADGQDVDIDVDAETADAQAKLAAIAAYARTIDGMDVDIDVDVDRDGTARASIGELVEALGGLTDALGAAARGVGGAGGGGGGITGSLGGFMGLSGPATAAIMAIAAVLGGALVAGLAAVAASAAIALAGVAALAVAGFGALTVAGVGAIGIIANFKSMVDKAGSAAQELSNGAKRLGRTFVEAMAPLSRAVFGSLAETLRRVRPLLEGLEDPFRRVGRAFASAIRDNIPAIQELIRGFGDLATEAAPLIAPVIDIMLELARIFLDIAKAAMPLLISAAGKFAATLRSIDTSSLAGGMATIKSHLQSWWNLIVQISNVFLGFIRAAGPAGQQLVDWLARGAEKLAQWLNSAEGQATMKQFFTDIVPLVQQIVTLVGNLLILFFQIVQVAAPALTLIFGLFNTVLGVIIQIVNWLTPWIQKILTITALMSVGLVWAVLKLIGFFTDLGDAADTAWEAIKTGATEAWNAARVAAAGIQAAWDATWDWMKQAASDAWGTIKEVVGGGVEWVKNKISTELNEAKADATTVWNGIKSAASTAWGAIKGIVSAGVGAVTGAVSSGFGRLRGLVSSAMSGMAGAVTSGWGTIRGAFSSGVQAILGFLSELAGKFRSAGRALMSALADGIRSAANLPFDAAKGALGGLGKLIPGSDAEEGPLSRLTAAGRAIPATIAAGIRKGEPILLNEMKIVLDKLGQWIEALGTGGSEKLAIGKAYKRLAEDMVSAVEGLQVFHNAIVEIGEQIEDVAQAGLEAWADYREAVAMAAIDASPEGQQLAALLAEGDEAEFGLSTARAAETLGDLETKLTDLQAELVDPARTRSRAAIESEIVNTERAIRDARVAARKVERDEEIRKLQEMLAARRDFAAQTAELERNGMTAASAAYRQSLQDQMDALRASLASGEISYATFVKRVKKILAPLGIQFDISAQTEQALAGGRNFIKAFAEGMKRASGGARMVLMNILKDLRNLLPGSEPRDRRSPLSRLDIAGAGIVDNLAAGIPKASKALVGALYKELAPVANIAPVLVGGAAAANPITPQVHIGELSRNFHFPAGPEGGYPSAEYAAVQIDQLFENIGGIR